MSYLVKEACAPYGGRMYPAEEPVNIWRMLNRLTQAELRSLAMSYAMQAPVPFEDKLLRVWASRDG
jgi:hypothetical protein